MFRVQKSAHKNSVVADKNWRSARIKQSGFCVCGAAGWCLRCCWLVPSVLLAEAFEHLQLLLSGEPCQCSEICCVDVKSMLSVADAPSPTAHITR